MVFGAAMFSIITIIASFFAQALADDLSQEFEGQQVPSSFQDFFSVWEYEGYDNMKYSQALKTYGE